jgi:hypothetical protein
METSIRNNIELEIIYQILEECTAHTITRSKLLIDALHTFNNDECQMSLTEIMSEKLNVDADIIENSIPIGKKKDVISIKLPSEEENIFEDLKEQIKIMYHAKHVQNSAVVKAALKGHLLLFIKKSKKKDSKFSLIERIKMLNKRAVEESIENLLYLNMSTLEQTSRECAIDAYFEGVSMPESFPELKDFFHKLGIKNTEEMVYDIVNSFVTIYSYGLLHMYPEKFQYYEPYQAVILRNNNGKIQLAKSKKWLKEHYLEYIALNNLSCMQDFASVIYSFGNILPCYYIYNEAKGCSNEIQDFPELLFSKINNELPFFYNDNKIVDKKMLKNWGNSLQAVDFLFESTDYLVIDKVSDLKEMKIDNFVCYINYICNRIKKQGLYEISRINDNEDVQFLIEKMIDSLKIKNNELLLGIKNIKE